MAKILSGTEVAGKIKEKIKVEVESLRKDGKVVGLDVILVGADSASQIYVRKKQEDCEEVGIVSTLHKLPEDISEEALLEIIENLNKDKKVSGILIQLPLPKHIDEKKVINQISPNKDVDAFHIENVGKIMLGDYRFLPCTPAGIAELLKYYNIEIAGKNALIIGRSNIVGKPMAMILLHEDATVTIAHSRTKNLKELALQSDIIVVAVGAVDVLTGDMVKEGAVVIDVGMNRKPDGKLVGDVNFEEVSKKASYITPVPGGVGPMTRAVLLENTLLAAKGNK